MTTKVSRLVLANTSVTPGIYGGSSSIPVITVDSTGRITNSANVSISIPSGTSIVANTDGGLIANGQTGVALTGTVLLGLTTTGVSSGTYGGTDKIPVVTVDTLGRVTSVANVSVTIPPAGVVTLKANTGLEANGTSGQSLSGNLSIGLSTTGVSSGTYGGVSISPSFTVDNYGRLSFAGNNTINIAPTQINSTTGTGAAVLAGSPTMTGAPLSPTAAVDTSNTMIATTAYVVNQGYLKGTTAVGQYANIASPTFTGAPLAPTAATGTSNTMIATTAFVQDANTKLKSYADATFAKGTTFTQDRLVTFNGSTLVSAANVTNTGVFGGSTVVPVITVDGTGRVTSVANTTITAGGGATLSAVDGSSSYYVGLSAASSGTWSDARVDTTNLYYNSSTQTLYATNYNTTSDLTLKDNVETIQSGLQTVKSMRGVSFTWKETGRPSYGVIAQEIEALLPDLVHDTHDKKSVNYNALIGFLIEAVKELSAEIDQLKNK